jgi:hypothetical protein
MDRGTKARRNEYHLALKGFFWENHARTLFDIMEKRVAEFHVKLACDFLATMAVAVAGLQFLRKSLIFSGGFGISLQESRVFSTTGGA